MRVISCLDLRWTLVSEILPASRLVLIFLLLGKRARLIEQHSPPEILVHGLVAPKDVDVLFQTFFDKVNPFLGLLDPVLHTPATTFARCPFLFTVICAVSSRYYPPKSQIYPIAMHFAKHAAANALIDGWKVCPFCNYFNVPLFFLTFLRRLLSFVKLTF
jgi:hypothetical protein